MIVALLASRSALAENFDAEAARHFAQTANFAQPSSPSSTGSIFVAGQNSSTQIRDKVQQNLPKADFTDIKDAGIVFGPGKGPQWQSVMMVIAIDGADHCGKSSLASWLAWQLGMPAVQLNLYLTNLYPIQWSVDDLARVVAQRIDVDRGRPVIIEGVLMLDALDQIRRKPDFLVFVRGGYPGSSLGAQIEQYQSRQKPLERANYVIEGHADD